MYIILSKFLGRLIVKLQLLNTFLLLKNEDRELMNVDSLTPLDNLTDKEIYFNYLEGAIEEADVKNIAVTGTYGSGKSSIIKTFQKKYPRYKYLNISLASFKEENNINEEITSDKKGKNLKENPEKESLNRLIELSILQQIFYKERHEDIPDSRFKRIKSISELQIIAISLGLVLWILSVFSIFNSTTLLNFFDADLALYLNDLKIVSITIGLLGLFVILTKTIRVFNNYKLNKLNVQSGEIEIGENIDKSILNHHLDEILYFFEVTDYNVVIIEDLDRFNDTEIFTKLRELNNLVNGSKQILSNTKRKIVFIYAIRDDMFYDKDRTKFFDYIIPIIPIINPSNSNEKINEKLSFHGGSKLPRQEFIDDVAIFIDDMRLLTNICNEYVIYRGNLGVGLNQDKLFAMVIYKNLCPNDFAELHNAKGTIFELISNKELYIEDKVKSFDDRIININKNITDIGNERIPTVRELRVVYINELRDKLVANRAVLGVNLKDINVSFKSLEEDEHFEQLIANPAGSIRFYDSVHNVHTSQVTFDQIQKIVDKKHTYSEREKNINDRLTNQVDKLKNEVERLRSEKNDIRGWSLQKILEDYNIKPAINSLNTKNNNLISYLLTHGYIDENYYDYISYFHEGTITKKDWEFLQSIKSRNDTEFTFKLDKPENLIKKISYKDFNNSAILNYDLIDFLLKNEYTFSPHIKSLIEQFKRKVEISNSFILGYLENGGEKPRFVKLLAKYWNEFWLFIEENDSLTIEKTDNYLNLIIQFSDIEDIKNLAKFSELQKYLQNKEDIHGILNEKKFDDKIKSVLLALDVKFNSLRFSNLKSTILKFIYDNNLYEINDEMIELMLSHNGIDTNNFSIANYTTIKRSELKSLNEYIENYIEIYIADVYLRLENNVREEESDYISLLNHKNISDWNKHLIIKKTNTLITDVSVISKNEISTILFEENRISPNWENIFKYYLLNSKVITKILVTYLNIESNYKALSKEIISSRDGDYPAFRESLLRCADLSDSSYLAFLGSILRRNELEIEGLNKVKVEGLINKILMLTEDNFNSIKEHFPELLIKFLEINVREYFKVRSEYELDADDIVAILKSRVFTVVQKLKFVEETDIDTIIESIALGNEICNLLSNTHQGKINFDLINAIFTDSVHIDTKLKIINNYFDKFTNAQLDELILKFPLPFSNIAVRGKRPIIANTSTHLEFVHKLKNRGYISKYTPKEKVINIYTFG